MKNQNFFFQRLFIQQDILDIQKSLDRIQAKIKSLDPEVDAEYRLSEYLKGKLTSLPLYMYDVLEDVRGILPNPDTK